MPIHDWTRVDAGLFHAFHQSWIVTLSQALNSGALPPDYYALPEQTIRGPIPDALTLRLPPEGPELSRGAAGLAVADAPPCTRLTRRAEEQIYVRKADHIAVRHRHGDIVAVIEIVSPGNKASSYALRTFVEKTAKYIAEEVHVLVIDLFPPSKRDPQGIHKAIWDEFIEEDFELPADKPLTLVSYDAGPEPVAYVEPVAVGDVLLGMPIFLKPGYYVPAPLETSYRRTWDEFFPAPFKRLLEAPPAEGSGR
jgi:Protein of unknown function (DUF4058)